MTTRNSVLRDCLNSLEARKNFMAHFYYGITGLTFVVERDRCEEREIVALVQEWRGARWVNERDETQNVGVQMEEGWKILEGKEWNDTSCSELTNGGHPSPGNSGQEDRGEEVGAMPPGRASLEAASRIVQLPFPYPSRLPARVGFC
ncbi:hypothetical protein EAG_10501 [Camponotus floridanus]|uniref:Uncharacterized protein n=1 Tax=Camponotus floridanus TaxID=104421 RepID=E2AF08_CAMFO|nr:hypothetical protein EAG_10501 [Camponotus floridanus]